MGGAEPKDGLTLLLSGSVPLSIPLRCFNRRELLEKGMVPNLCVAHSLVCCLHETAWIALLTKVFLEKSCWFKAQCSREQSSPG